MEKYSTWTNRAYIKQQDGGFESGLKFSNDELITSMMLLWTTRSTTTAMRNFKESIPLLSSLANVVVPAAIPVGVAIFPHDMITVPCALVKDVLPNIVHCTRMPTGGHFPALEEPQLLADDIRAFVSKMLFN